MIATAKKPAGKTKSVRTEVWLTPHEWFQPGALGRFDLDPCAPALDHYTATQCFTIKEDGLKQEWPAGSTVWLNPPYKGIYPWIDKAIDHAKRGGSGIGLVFVRTDAKWMQRWLDQGRLSAMLFLEGRIKFKRGGGEGGETGAPAGSVLIGWGKASLSRLVEAHQSASLYGPTQKAKLKTGGVMLKFYGPVEAWMDANPGKNPADDMPIPAALHIVAENEARTKKK